jgi:hypothetical protein
MTERKTTSGTTAGAGAVRSGRSRRFRLLVGAGAVAAVLLFAVLPGYVASRPRFFARYPSIAEKVSTWSTSPHAEALCSDCHVAPERIPQFAFRARMAGDFYLSLVWRSRAPRVFGAPTNAACLQCHNNLRSVSPKGDLQIPHRAHVRVLKMKCVECHKYLVHEKSPEGKNTPPMIGCLKCHDDDIAEDDCNACHTEKAAPPTHRAKDWLVIHPDQASDAACAKCHRWAKRWCADCHKHRPASHGRDWRAVHGERIDEHRNCEACHKESFCVPCHGDFPRQNLDPKLKLVE